MAESYLLLSKCRDLLATSSHERFEILVNQLATPQESIEVQSARTLLSFCANKFPNCLTLMLLRVYLSSSGDIARHQSILILYPTLVAFRTYKIRLSLVALNEIKPILISCLIKMQEASEMMILRRIVFFVAHDVFSLGEWDELSDCILSFAETQPLKAFHVFVELPPVHSRFIEKIMQRIFKEAEKVLLSSENVEDWSLGLEALVKIGVQLLNLELRMDQIMDLLTIFVNPMGELVKKGMEEFVVQGLENLERFLFVDKDLYGYNMNQCLFVGTFAFKIREFGTKINEVAIRINRMVVGSNNPQEEETNQGGYDLVFFEHLNKLSLFDIVEIVLSGDSDQRSKDMAIRRLNLLLSKQNPKMEEIPVSVGRKLQPILVSWLSKEGISESMFKVLGEVVYHVADWIMIDQQEKWVGLRDYIASKCKTEFEKAVYIFQCLTIQLEEEEFLIPVMDNLLPEISKRLKETPSVVLVDNSGWVLAFTGAFCAIIHLIQTVSHVELVKEIAYKMIDSVRELVEKEMEVGLVRRAFRDVEIIVKQHLEWIGVCEYKFVKGMLWKLYEIKGMKMESRIVLWRINFVLERGVPVEYKEFPKSEHDWIDPHDDEEEDEDEDADEDMDQHED